MATPAYIGWKDGCRFKVDPNVAFKEIEKLKGDGGEIVPESIVIAAKKKRNPLHSEFEWDDTVAAKIQREDTARKMLRSIVVTYAEAPKVKTRHFNVVTDRPSDSESKPRKVYRSTDDILSDPDMRAELLKRAFGELVAFQVRFRGLQELAPVFRAIEESLERV